MPGIKLISTNIEADKHWDRVLSFIKKENPDVFCAQEIYEDDVALVEKETGLHGSFVANCRIDFTNRYHLNPRGLWGIAIFSKQLFTATSFVYKRGNDIPVFIDGEPNSIRRCVLIADVSIAEAHYRIATTHFTWTPDGNVTQEQETDLSSLLSILQSQGDFVLCGDFNAPRGKKVFDTLAQLYTDNIPQKYRSSLDPVLHRIGNDNDLMVDGLFSTPAYRVENVSLVEGVSDHCAVKAYVEKISYGSIS